MPNKLALLFVLFVLFATEAKKLQVNSLTTLRQALVNEGLEITLGMIDKPSTVQHQAQKLCNMIQTKLNNPLERFQRLLCPKLNAPCASCFHAAKNNLQNLAPYMISQVACNLENKTPCACSTTEAVFFSSAASFSAVLPSVERDPTLRLFLMSYSPDYDVEVSTKVGLLKIGEQDRTSTLRDASSAFDSDFFKFGKDYVACTSIEYTDKRSGKTIETFYSCREFHLEIFAVNSIAFLYHLHQQTERSMPYNQMKEFFDLFKRFSDLLKANEANMRQSEDLRKDFNELVEECALGCIASLKKAKKSYEQKIASLEEGIKNNNARLDNAVEEIINFIGKQVESNSRKVIQNMASGGSSRFVRTEFPSAGSFIPKLPTFSMPNMPTVNNPTVKIAPFNIPTVNAPKIPTINMPTVKIPTVTDPKMPSVNNPTATAPKIPAINMPTVKIPTITAPKVSTINSPVIRIGKATVLNNMVASRSAVACAVGIRKTAYFASNRCPPIMSFTIFGESG